jgi:hypothetical protein
LTLLLVRSVIIGFGVIFSTVVPFPLLIVGLLGCSVVFGFDCFLLIAWVGGFFFNFLFVLLASIGAQWAQEQVFAPAFLSTSRLSCCAGSAAFLFYIFFYFFFGW